MGRIRSLRLSSYKGFEDFTVTFGDFSVLVGPNNAGKSTIIEGLRASAQMLRAAGLRRGPQRRSDGPGLFAAHPLVAGSLQIEAENLRHEFRTEETRLTLRLAGSNSLSAVWPEVDTEEAPFFYVAGKDHSQPRTLRDIRENFPPPYIVPTLGPLEPNEAVLTEDYVVGHRSTRLSTRHFRNNLLIMRGISESDGGTRLDKFYRFAHEWLPEGIELEHPRTRVAEKSAEIDVFYREGRVPKEIVWAGDGLQVFLQVLLHVFLAQGSETVVLDEPDVFLHPDLQRRVVRLFEASDQQVILATHSSEILLESPRQAVTWVDRTRKRALRAPKGGELESLEEALGSGIGLRLAEVLRRKSVVIVEGGDVKVLRRLGASLGRNRLTTEARGLGLLKLGGLDNWPRLQGFSWLADNLLDGAVSGLVLLDRDVRSPSEIRAVQSALQEAGLACHIWERHEVENYLLHPAAIARLAGCDPEEAEAILDSACESLKAETIGLGVKYWSEGRSAKRSDIKSVTTEVLNHVDASWGTAQDRLNIVPGKEALASVNRSLEAAGYSTVSALRLATELLPDEIPGEMVRVLEMIEDL